MLTSWLLSNWSCQRGTQSSQATRQTTSTPHTLTNSGVRASWLAAALLQHPESVQDEALWPSWDVNEEPELRPKSGPLLGVPCNSFPTNSATRMDSELFRTWLLRRLQSPSHLNARVYRCGRLLDSLDHHRSACAVSAALGRRGFAVEMAVARICREGGARVSTNVMVRDLDLSQVLGVEVVAEGSSRPNLRLTRELLKASVKLAWQRKWHFCLVRQQRRLPP